MDMGLLLGAGLAIAIAVLAVLIVIAVFYFLTLHRALERCAPRNRLMEPGLVWLGFIPLFNIVWAFFIAIKVPDSLKNEFRDRGMDDGSDYGKGIALTNAIMGAVSLPLGFIIGSTQSAGLSILSNLMSLVGLVLFIVFWVRISGYSTKLLSDRSALADRGYDDRDFDDAPRADRGRTDGGPSDAVRQDDRNRIR